MIPAISLVLSIATGILAAFHYDLVCVLLPALYGSLFSQLLSWLIPPVVLITTILLTKLLPTAVFLPLLLALNPIHIASLPLIDLILLFTTTTFSMCADRLSFLTFISSFLLTITTCSALDFNLSQLYLNLPLNIHIPCLITAIVATNLYTRSKTLESIHRPIATNKGKRNNRKKLSFSTLPLPIHLILIFFSSLLVSHLVTNETVSLIKLIHPRTLPNEFTLLDQKRGPTGLISVIQSSKGYRVLFADFSALGGLWVHPDYHPDSIFSQFYVHEAVRLTNLPNKVSTTDTPRALCIGVGIGIVANALHQHGVLVEAVEIDPVVADFAKRYFELSAPVVVKDALDFLSESTTDTYDYVIHDVFTGGSVPTALFSNQTLNRIKGVMKENGVLAVNFVGITDMNSSADGTMATALVMDRLASVFKHVRMFSDGDTSVTHNLVFFASNIPERVTFRPVTDDDCLESELRHQKLSSFEKLEVKREDLGPAIDINQPSNDWILYKGMWDTFIEFRQVLHQVYPKTIWPALLAAESRK